jgi:RNA polymerase sigma factor (sigma-70 family)
MAISTPRTVLGFLRTLAATPEADALSDGQLLGRFVARRDEDAFAALLRRRGPLVLGVCRQIVGDPHLAEDVFQATFLVLARKAASVRRKQSLAGWLYRVANNLAVEVRRQQARRQRHERQASLMLRTEPAPTGNDWQPILHEEVNRLPAKYRVPVVLCYLYGMTNEEAARELCWPIGTVKGRLTRARALLHTRLTRRGLALGAGGVAALVQQPVSAAVPAQLAEATLHAALGFAAGKAAVGVASAVAVPLAMKALRTMMMTRLLLVGLMLLALGVAGTIGSVWASQAQQAADGSEQPTPAAEAPDPALQPAPALAQETGTGSVTNNKVELTSQPADDFGPEVKGLRARLTLAKKQFTVGEPIVPTYVVKNVSAEKISIFHCGFWPNHQVIVRDATGNKPPLTPFGLSCGKVFGGPRDENASVVLNPGGEDANEFIPDLTKIYDLNKPGRYSVEFIYDDECLYPEKKGSLHVKLPSNVVAFDIVPAVPGGGKYMAVSKPVIVNQVAFEAVVESKCAVPAQGAKQPLDVGFRLTNQGGKKLLFNLYDTLRPVLKSAKGKTFPLTGVRLRTAPAKPVALGPMQTQTVWRTMHLEWQKKGKALSLWLVGPDGSGGSWIFEELLPDNYRLAFEYECTEKMLANYLGTPNAVQAGPGQTYWIGKVVTEEVAFEISLDMKPAQDLLTAPVAKLIADLDSPDGSVRVAATKELFRRGKDVLADLKQAGAKQIAPFGGTVDGTRRLDLVYSLLEGLPPNLPQLAISYKTDSFGLHVTKGTTKEAIVVMGNKYGFTLAGEFRADTRPNCYVKIAAGKSLAQVMQDVLSHEPAVTTLNLNYVEATKKPTGPAPTVKYFDDPNEVARMIQFYPHGFNFVNAIHLDGKIIWISKIVQGNKVQMKSWQFTTVDEFKKAFVKENITKEASVEVHLPAVNPALKQAATNAQLIIDFLQEKGYKKAGAVSN